MSCHLSCPFQAFQGINCKEREGVGRKERKKERGGEGTQKSDLFGGVVCFANKLHEPFFNRMAKGFSVTCV